jgi:hypothetical protein
VPTATCPTVRVTEPGRTPLHLVIRRPVDVGRDCDGLLLADAELSRRHLRLSATAGRLTVQDLNSTNGTRVDGTALFGPTGVRPGQVVTFGQCRLEVLDGEPGAAEAPDDDPLRRTSIDVVAAAAAADPLPTDKLLSRGGTLTIVFSEIEQSTRRGDPVEPLRSAKRTVTVLRTAADTGAGTGVAGVPARAVPHSPQNFSLGSTSVAQPGHRRARAAPHSTQKRFPSRFSKPQCAHSIGGCPRSTKSGSSVGRSPAGASRARPSSAPRELAYNAKDGPRLFAEELDRRSWSPQSW